MNVQQRFEKNGNILDIIRIRESVCYRGNFPEEIGDPYLLTYTEVLEQLLDLGYAAVKLPEVGDKTPYGVVCEVLPVYDADGGIVVEVRNGDEKAGGPIKLFFDHYIWNGEQWAEKKVLERLQVEINTRAEAFYLAEGRGDASAEAQALAEAEDRLMQFYKN